MSSSSTAQTATAPPPPPPKRGGGNGRPSKAAPPAARTQSVESGTVQFGTASGITRKYHRICIYGPGGIGKSTLASLAPSPKVLDIEHSTADIDSISRVTIPDGQEWSLELVRAALQDPDLWNDCETIVIDTATKLEELCLDYILRAVPKNNNGDHAERIEDYGYGKGYTHLYDAFMLVLSDLDRLWLAGKNIVLIAHDCTTRVPNPEGEDWIRYEPRLSDPSSGKGSIRLKVREWCDHLFRIGYDIVTKDGKAKGSGSRTIYPVEMPYFMAKSRTLRDPIVFENECDDALWRCLTGGEQ